MGIPKHYAAEIPVRCWDLIERLYPIVEKDEELGEPHRGPLTTTLLLALATPMVVLPIERIDKQHGQQTFVDENQVDAHLGDQVKATFKKRLGETEFHGGLDWAFVNEPPQFMMSQPLDQGIAERLSSASAKEAAANMLMTQFAACLRNSLAHGGIMYLDSDGRTSEKSTAMFAFVSAQLDKKRPKCDYADTECSNASPPVAGLRILRISESGFREFLKRWASWLQSSHIAHAVTHEFHAAV